MRQNLSPRYLIKITEVFQNNNWEIDDAEDNSKSLFNRYCDRMSEIKEDRKKDLILDLTKRYLRIQYDQYLSYLIDIVKGLISHLQYMSSETTICVLPMLKPGDKEKNLTKSSQAVAYMFNDPVFRYDNDLSRFKYALISDQYVDAYLKLKNVLFLLVDDYIGTGDTAISSIQQIMQRGVREKDLAIVAIVAQERGLNNLKKYNIPVECSIIRNRGISDFYEGNELNKNLKLMQEIEKQFDVDEDFQFGYGKSEALITMCRTPNNTFPVFWQEKGKNNAPFPRY